MSQELIQFQLVVEGRVSCVPLQAASMKEYLSSQTCVENAMQESLVPLGYETL